MNEAYKFENISEKNADEWDDFLSGQPYHNIFQSGKLYTCLKDSKNYQPDGIIVRITEHNQIIGGYVIYKIKEIQGLASIFATRAVLNGGPVIKQGYEHIIPDLCKLIVQTFDKDAIYTEIWNMFPQEQIRHLFTTSFEHLQHLNYFIHLNRDENTLFNNISKSTKKHIKKAEKFIKIKEVTGKHQFDLLYERLQDTYNRLNIPLISKEIFMKIYQAKLGLFLLAYYENIPIASRVVLSFGNELYDWYAGDMDEYRHFYPNELLVWWTLKYGLKNHFKWFNFGGAGKPHEEYGPREFKRRFGGQLVEYGRYRHVNSNISYSLMKLGMNVRSIYRKL